MKNRKSMSILEIGIETIRDKVNEAVTRYPEAQAAEKELYTELHKLQAQIGFEKIAAIEAAINVSRSADTFAAFRVGVTNGLRLANDVRALIGSEGIG